VVGRDSLREAGFADPRFTSDEGQLPAPRQHHRPGLLQRRDLRLTPHQSASPKLLDLACAHLKTLQHTPHLGRFSVALVGVLREQLDQQVLHRR
jgi:hypothetical protein